RSDRPMVRLPRAGSSARSHPPARTAAATATRSNRGRIGRALFEGGAGRHRRPRAPILPERTVRRPDEIEGNRTRGANPKKWPSGHLTGKKGSLRRPASRRDPLGPGAECGDQLLDGRAVRRLDDPGEGGQELGPGVALALAPGPGGGQPVLLLVPLAELDQL